MGTVKITNDDASIGGDLTVGGTIIQTLGRQTPTIGNGWVGTNVSFYKDALGIVHLDGAVDGTAATGATIFTLPIGYRPTPNNAQLILTGTTGVSRSLIIHTDGSVTIPTTADVFFITSVTYATF
jgi:hypothetical protein